LFFRTERPGFGALFYLPATTAAPPFLFFNGGNL
jgi:hypothetical protein